ncbi:MAG: ribonuclease E inhibitor RraB [Pseudomonas sp.]
MITLETLQSFFSDTRQKNTSTSQPWSIDEVCRWSYFFVDEDRERLVPVARHLESLGYAFIGIVDPDDADEDPFFYLQLDRIELHTPASLHARVLELYGIAEQFGIADYDGMNVGPA